MRTYLYGLILERNAHLVPAHIVGIGGATLQPLDCGAVTALVSVVETASSNSLDDIRAHDHAMQAVVHHGATASAVRFGQTFRDEQELRGHLTPRAIEIATLLEQHDGCVEMRLLLRTEDREPSTEDRKPVGPGAAYLESLRSSSRASGLALREAFGPVVRSERVDDLPQSRGVVFAHLIKREDEERYREVVASHPALGDVAVVGPLALYAFAEPA